MWVCGYDDEFVNIGTGHTIDTTVIDNGQQVVIYRIEHREIVLFFGDDDEQVGDFLERLFTGTTVLNWR